MGKIKFRQRTVVSDSFFNTVKIDVLISIFMIKKNMKKKSRNSSNDITIRQLKNK